MGHMQKQITGKMRGWMVETRDAGTCYVPGDVVSVPDYFKSGVELRAEDADTPDVIWDHLVKTLSDYVEGRTIEAIEVVEGYFGRWSAPGYLDCTEWNFSTSVRELRKDLGDD